MNIEEKCGINCAGALRLKYPGSLKSKTKKNSYSEEPIKNVYANSLTGDSLSSIEQSILNWPRAVESAEFETESCAGNCENFTKILANISKEQFGVTFLMHTDVKAFDIDWNELNDSDKKTKAIKAIYTSKGKIAVDSNTEVIIAAGSWTPKLLWLCGYFAPIYPMKGYSVAIDLPPEGSDNRPEESAIPSRMLIDQKLYISRLGNQIRITSMGEFCGWDTKPDYTIDRIFREAGKIRVPGLKPLFDASPTRCGLRPYSADGIIILGRIEDTTNLSVNVGPGFNGWKISYSQNPH